MTAEQENRKAANAAILIGVALMAFGFACLLIPGGGVGLVLFGGVGFVMFGAGAMIHGTEDERARRG